MAKLPAFQFYPGDWRKDMGVQSLSYFDRGVWWEILCLMHESERRGVLILNGTAMGDESLSRLLGLDKQILTTTLTTLLTSGVASREDITGAIVCRRMVRDENIRKIRTEAGLKGGNPNLLNQKSTTGVKQKSTPSSSSSSSITDINTKTLARSVPPEELAGTLPLVDKTEYRISRTQVAGWTEAYPGIDVTGELKRFKVWLEGNPTRKKTARGITRAIVSWLSRAQDKTLFSGGNNGTNQPSATQQRIDKNRAAIRTAAIELGFRGAGDADIADGGSLPLPGLERST